MFRRPPHRPHGPAGRRRGAILLVVLTMLALFAVIGLSFVLYAESEANAARLYKEGASANTKPIDPTDAVNGFLGQMIFQPNVNTSSPPTSALYGHELARLMYGQPGNTSAYNGVGIYSENLTMTLNASPFSLHRTQVVRYGQYFSNPLVNSSVTVLPDQTYGDPTWNYSTATDNTKLKFVSRAAPYTYPDRSNIYLGVQDPATGRVVKPSYHAPSLFGPLAANNTNWYTPQGYFQLLRPRTIDNLLAAEITYLSGPPAGFSRSMFPVPVDLSAAEANQLGNIFAGNVASAPDSFKRGFPFIAPNPDGSLTGDVQNVKYGEGQQTADSLWIDAGLPRVRHRGRLLQPLIAATVLPLDGRVNSGVAGNLANGGTAQGSNQGFGPAEVSLARILNAASTTTANAMVQQRYGNAAATVPPPLLGTVPARTTNFFHPDNSAPTVGTSATYPPTYSRVDFDGNGVAQPATPTNFSTAYSYPVGTYGSVSGSTEFTQSPLMFNPFQWNPLATTGRATAATPALGTQFPIADARYLSARYSEKVAYTRAMTSLGNFDTTNPPVPFGFSANSPLNPMNRARALLTPLSNRLSRPGLAPMAIGNLTGVLNNFGAPALSLPAGASAPILADPAAAGTAVVGPKFDLVSGLPFTIPVGTNGSAVGGDITGATLTNAANLRAFLQGVDLNRPLADYRDPASRPLPAAMVQDWPFVPGPDAIAPALPVFPTTVTPKSFQQASADRQALATDIFTRLCVALNARVFLTDRKLMLPQWVVATSRYEVTVAPADFTTPPVGYVSQTWSVSQAEYDALRWVAQLSANIVDAIDPDDVSTPFVWNPVLPAPGNPLDLTAVANYTIAVGGLNDRVVFGVEKPKLLVNEVFAEVANKEGDYGKNELTAADKFTVRFFVELLNPGNAEGPINPLPASDQSARGAGYARLQFAANAPFPAFSSYRIQVYDTGLAMHNELALTTNTSYVLGQPTTAVPKLQATFDATMVPTAGSSFLVEPNNGEFASVAGMMPARNGFCVVGPKVTATETPPTAYAPQQTDATKVDGFMLPKLPVAGPPIPDQMEYDSTVAPVDSDVIKPQVVTPLNATDLHAVVLQRLANPYWPENASPYNPANGPYNPYVTVDYMAGVEVHDGIRIGKRKPGDSNGTRTVMPATPDKNFAIGRAQPYAGFQSQAAITAPVTVLTEASAPTPPFGQTLSVLQNPTAVPVAPSSPTRTTFFQHNSLDYPTSLNPVVFPPPPAGAGQTLIVPFNEPFQPDRRLINPLEILHLTAAPSHLLTRNFATPDATSLPATPKPPYFYQQELSRVALPPASPGVPSLLYRALDVLNVKPWTYGVPHAGRTPGGININVINDDVGAPGTATPGDSAVFNALLDPQPANTFIAGNAPGNVGAIWQALRTSRSPGWTTPVPAVGATVDEWDPNATPPGPGKDRPFKGLGIGQYDTTTGGMLNAQGLESTLLRSGATPGTPLFLNTAQTDPYRQLEPLRKAFNNLTTVSDNFLVVFTVGFFDIDEPSLAQTPSRVVLRREAYEQVPGDLRSQFTAVLDRTGLAVDANNPTSGQTGKFAQAAAATNLTRVADRTVSGRNYATYMVRFPANGTMSTPPSTAAEIKVRDMPTANGSVFTLKAGSLIRFGDGPNANTFSVLYTGATVVTSPGPPVVSTTYPFFDDPTGLATVTIDSGIEVDASGNPVVPPLPALPQRLPNPHSAGELLSLPDNEDVPGGNPNANTVFVPGNPGAVPGFDPTDLRFRGVVRYFGRLVP